ncbi:MAG: TetR/AcrR family transcriptional regulator [Pseudomonadota bacterium]
MARKQGSHSDITGPRIHAAALKLFAEHGFAAVSMRQIAAEVGVQAGAIYNYVPHKQALLANLMQGHMDGLLADIEPHLPEGDPMAALDAFVRFHIGYHLDRVDLVFISYMELRALEPENFDLITRLRGDYEKRLERILIDGTRDGVFDIADPKITTLALIAMLTGVTNWYREGGRLDQGDIADHYAAMARRMVCAAP